uniref:Uncharacterized protein n=1 Tax=Fervidobacterium thailandense TaxID=1008305 RepID=A0A7C4W3P3_9BACT
MKKFFVSLLLAVALFAFAAEATFSIGTKLAFTGSVRFELKAYPKGVDATGSYSLDAAVSIPLSPKSVTAAGAEFGLNYGFGAGTSIPVSFSLKSIYFETDFFKAKWYNYLIMVSDFFTGKDYDTDSFVGSFANDFSDVLELKFPNIVDVYFVDKKSEGQVSWFSDMVLLKRAIDPFTIILGLYNTGDTSAYEFGAHVAGEVNFGFFKPTLRLFGGMVEDAGNMVPAYEFRLTGSLALIPNVLTVEPTILFTDKLAKLDYKSTNVSDGKYVQARVTFTDKWGVVIPKFVVTTKYDFTTEKVSIPLDEASIAADFGGMFALFAKVTNADIMVPTNTYKLYSEAKLAINPVILSGKASWNDLTKLDQFAYINAKASVNLTPLYIEGNLGWIQNANGYNVFAKYNLSQNVSLEGFYGTIKDNNSNGVYDTGDYLPDPDWNVKLVYNAKF